jgi:hypothetical protein
MLMNERGMQQARSRPAISAVMVSCHEAEVIEPCPLRVASWVGEIVVMDMPSTDGTCEIAQRYGSQLLDYERLPHVEPVRQIALQ